MNVPSSSSPPTVVILAGGRSRRMGVDKATLSLDGHTFLERSAMAALDAGLNAVVIGREQPGDWRIPEVDFFDDEQPDAGPLAALATALRRVRSDVLAIGCDMPCLSGIVLLWLALEATRAPAPLGVVCAGPNGVEPLLCCYRLESLPLIDRLLASGERSLQALLDGGSFVKAVIPEEMRRAVTNVNTPEEFRRLIERD